jgi:hypothetical protein
MMILSETEADQGTLMKTVICHESNFVKSIAKAVVQYFTSLGKEHYGEECLNL